MYNYFLHIHTALIIKKKKWLNALGRKKNDSSSAFIILCEPRSGSTLLHTFLNYHPHILSYGEVLRERLQANKPIEEPMPDLLKPNTPKLKAIGLKIFYEYADDTRYQKFVSEIAANRNIKVIHLVRRDKLKQYVSLKIAQKTNVWSSSRKTNIEKITVASADYQTYLNKSLQKKLSLLGMLSQHEILEVNYEDLIDSNQHTLEIIQAFLKVTPKRLLSLLSKQNSDRLEDIIENYEEVKSMQANSN